jgi:hypothetical protein
LLLQRACWIKAFDICVYVCHVKRVLYVKLLVGVCVCFWACLLC